MLTVDSVFRTCFNKLGSFVGNHPKKCVVVPVILSLVLSLGTLRFHYIYEVDQLYVLKNGDAEKEANTINQFFPQNTTYQFSPSRILEPGRFTRIIVQRKDGNSIVNSESWVEVMELDHFVHDVTVMHKGKFYNYSNLCATWNGDCYENKHLGLGELIPQIENGSQRFIYPIMFNPINYDIYPINLFFGGFTFVGDGTSTIKSVKALSIDYFARIDTPDQRKIARKWEEAMVDRLGDLQSHWKTLKVSYLTYSSISIESDKNNFSGLPFIPVSVFFMLIFITFTSYTGNWITSKSLVSVMGLISAILGTIAAVGVLCLIGVPVIGLNTAMLFVALGVGIDDTFVMLAAWWKTPRSDSVVQRMAHCYSEAGISITITTLTDMLSFYVGLLSSVPSIQIFCAYAGTAVLFIYIWHIFFFGGVMALSGHFEKQNRHSVFIWKIVPVIQEDKQSNEKEQENQSMVFFRDKFSPFLTLPSTKVFVLLGYALYIGLSCWGVYNMKEGLDASKTAHSSSYLFDYFQMFNKYFRDYPYRSQIMVYTPLDYSKKESQTKVLNYIGNITDFEGMTPEYGENWLTDFLRFAENYKEFYNFSISTEQEFIDTLRTHFLDNSSVYSNDVKFNDNFTKIIASRYVIQHHAVPGADSEKRLLAHWRILEKAEKELNVTTFHPFNSLIDITIILQSMAITLVSIAAVIVLVVTIIFMPNITSTLIVFFSIASVELGILGFMVFFNINLDTISIIALIMCIGFSVDFPAHVTYAYMSSKSVCVEDRVRDTMHSLGLPIVQSAISTIIAVCGVMLVESYIYQVFFKIVCLVMLFSVLNALFVLPVLLLIFKPDSGDSICSRQKVLTISESELTSNSN